LLLKPSSGASSPTQSTISSESHRELCAERSHLPLACSRSSSTRRR
jgi:hypothetical protein